MRIGRAKNSRGGPHLDVDAVRVHGPEDGPPFLSSGFRVFVTLLRVRPCGTPPPNWDLRNTYGAESDGMKRIFNSKLEACLVPV